MNFPKASVATHAARKRQGLEPCSECRGYGFRIAAYRPHDPANGIFGTHVELSSERCPVCEGKGKLGSVAIKRLAAEARKREQDRTRYQRGRKRNG